MNNLSPRPSSRAVVLRRRSDLPVSEASHEQPSQLEVAPAIAEEANSAIAAPPDTMNIVLTLKVTNGSPQKQRASIAVTTIKSGNRVRLKQSIIAPVASDLLVMLMHDASLDHELLRAATRFFNDPLSS
jgi:hypothetical protein